LDDSAYPISSIEDAFERATHGTDKLPYRGRDLDFQIVSTDFTDADLPIRSRVALIAAIAIKELAHEGTELYPLEMGQKLDTSNAGSVSAVRLTVVDSQTHSPVAECGFSNDYFVENRGVYTVVSEPGDWLFCSAEGYAPTWFNVVDLESTQVFLAPGEPRQFKYGPIPPPPTPA
jgi:hypothetical protein